MKLLLKKIFFADSPACGAFYALTQFLLAGYLAGSFLVFVWGNGWAEPLPPARSERLWSSLSWYGAGAVLLLCLLYYLFLTIGFYLTLLPARWRRSRWIYLFCGCALLAWGISWGYLSCVWIVLVTAFFFAGLLPCLFSGRRWALTLGGALAWCVGVLMLLEPIVHCCANLGKELCLPCSFIKAAGLPAERFRLPDLSGNGWVLRVAIALFLLILWYYLTAEFFARLGRRKISSLFGTGVLAWWGSGAAVFLFFYILVHQAGGEVSSRIAGLEQRFGRPVTAEALGELYFNGRRPDAAYWERWKENAEMFSSVLEQGTYSAFLRNPAPVKISGEGMAEWREKFEQHAATLAEWEALCADSIPPKPREFRRGHLIDIQLAELASFRLFNRLELWRIYFSLADGRIDAALSACRRMEQVKRYLQGDPILISALVWAACEDLRLAGIEMMLESGLLSERDLRQFAGEMEEAENLIPQVQEQVLYGEAVWALDCCEFLSDVFPAVSAGYEENFHFSPRAVRFFLPQLWWYWRREKAEMARTYDIPDLSQYSPVEERRGPCMLSRMLSPSFNSIERCLSRLLARYRGIRGLIMAELYRREHGHWPESLPGLPLDPFSGNPLLYRQGESLYEFRVMTKKALPPSLRIHPPEPEYVWDSRPAILSVPAVQVWSVGWDRKDGGGFPQSGGKRCDDVRAIIRLKESIP